MRLHRPIGFFLVYWPTLWALFLAAEGMPSIKNLVIFTLGTLLMRSAGCVINDYADRDFDGHVERTKERPLITGEVSEKEALVLFGVLSAAAFVLVLFTNQLTIVLSFGGLALAACYPFMKRVTTIRTVVLGAAFSWGIPMAFAAETNSLDPKIWLLFTSAVVWSVIYDTQYAMVDRDDDIKIGVKSTAVLFGEQDRFIIACLQFMTIFAWGLVGQRFELGTLYNLALVVAAGLFVYQQYLIAERKKEGCFKAFLNNNYVGMAVLIGIVLQQFLGK